MTCHNCRIVCAKAGRRSDGLQRYRCSQCGKTFSDRKQFGVFGHKQIDEDKALMALRLLVEGCSIRTAERITGMHRDTIMKCLVIAGQKCENLLAEKVKGIPVSEVQVDELWGFCRKKEANRRIEDDDYHYTGDAWCYIGIERRTKLVLAFELGRRVEETTVRFTAKIAKATSAEQYFQLSSDGFPSYPFAVGKHLWGRCSFAQLVKLFANQVEGQRRYSPPKVTGIIKKPVYGDPDNDRICTSHVERNNLTVRMRMRRLTRLTNSFSKKWLNLRAALALHFAYYNFCVKHSTIRRTPAMAAGVTDHAWELHELLATE